MISIAALSRVLPVSDLRPKSLASVGGLVQKQPGKEYERLIELLEPPAGRCVPYVDPIDAMTVLFLHSGFDNDSAVAKAKAEYANLRPRLELIERVKFFDDVNSSFPEHIPISVFTEFLLENQLTSADVIDYLERIGHAVTAAPLLDGPYVQDGPWSLVQLHQNGSPESMIEFLPGNPWDDYEAIPWIDNFPGWRDEMRPVAERLKEILSEPVYYFKIPDCDTDDDNVHRFLLLHLCCMTRPESAYVKFILEASGARDVDEFKAAMISPESYFEPFKMCDAFWGLEPNGCRLNYIPSHLGIKLGIVFETLAAQRWAESLLLQHPHAHVFIIAPAKLANEEWLGKATINCNGWALRNLDTRKRYESAELLEDVDELFVVSNARFPWNAGVDPEISGAIEDLLWRAHLLKIPIKFSYINGHNTHAPLTYLEERGVPERIAEQDKARWSLSCLLRALAAWVRDMRGSR